MSQVEITYGDKELNRASGVPVEKKWRFEDANEVKAKVNANSTDAEARLAALEADATKWKGAWDQNQIDPYELRDQVLDGGWLMIANKQTNARPAPQPVGTAAFLMDSAIFTTPSEEAVVYSGQKYTFSRPGWLREIRVWAPELGVDINYRILLIDNTNANPIVRVVDAPILNEGAWKIVAAAEGIIAVGDELIVVLDALNSGTSSQFQANWFRTANDNATQPTSGNWNRRTQNDLVRFNYTDADTITRQAQLGSVTPNSTITITELADPQKFIRYLVNSQNDTGTSYEYGVAQQEIGTGGEPGITEGCSVEFDIPQSQPTKYVEQALFWDTNQPTFAAVEGFLEFDGVAQPGKASSGFGVDIKFQEAEVSPDWDVQTFSEF